MVEHLAENAAPLVLEAPFEVDVPVPATIEPPIARPTLCHGETLFTPAARPKLQN